MDGRDTLSVDSASLLRGVAILYILFQRISRGAAFAGAVYNLAVCIFYTR
jgi:hypothetical protein